MQTVMSTGTKTSERPGITYRTVCQNPGCGAIFDLRIAPENASLLSGTMACPRCHRRGGECSSHRAVWAESSLLPSCSTERPVWPRRGLTRKSRFSNNMNARVTHRSSHDRPLKNYLRRERKVTGVYSKIDSDLRLPSSIRPLHFHPGRLARNSYEPLKSRTADLRRSRLIRSACSSQTSASWRSGRPRASR